MLFDVVIENTKIRIMVLTRYECHVVANHSRHLK